jgi:hypothetical protein
VSYGVLQEVAPRCCELETEIGELEGNLEVLKRCKGSDELFVSSECVAFWCVWGLYKRWSGVY